MFIYSEKATKFCEIFPFTVCTVIKSKGKISKQFGAFSEYMNFTFCCLEIKPVAGKQIQKKVFLLFKIELLS